MPLRFSVIALLMGALSLQSATADNLNTVNISVNDKQCDPMTLTVPAGKSVFIIKNNSMKALEWEILKGVLVVEERENIAPGFIQKMTVDLAPGEYQTTCGLLTNPRGKLTVTGQATAPAPLTTNDLVTPLAEYKFYLMSQSLQFAKLTTDLDQAVKSADTQQSQKRYLAVRNAYQQLKPVASLFPELDSAIDAATTDSHSSNIAALSEKLLTTSQTLKTTLSTLPMPLSALTSSMAKFTSQLSSSDLSAQQAPAVNTGLSDLQANMVSIGKLVELLHPILEKSAPTQLSELTTSLNSIDHILATYPQDQASISYGVLTDTDRQSLKRALSSLANSLSQLPSTLELP